MARTTPRGGPDPRVIIVDGYGVKLTVNRGHVVIYDNDEEAKRERRLSRVDAKTSDGIARIVILAETGYVSLEVLRWARALNIGIVQLDRRGDMVMVTPGTQGDPRIRSTQVLASPGGPYQQTGEAIVYDLLAAKLAGQIETLRYLGATQQAISVLSGNVSRMRGIEGNTALGYWKAWADRVFVPFRPEDLKLLPAHWYRFTSRASVNGENRNATDPVNAMLNYSYQVCFTEAVYACHVCGLDPDFGLMHGTASGKPGMALDLMEPLRPIADRVVLDMLDHGKGIPYGSDGRPAYISAECVYELADGTCRLTAPLTHELAARVSMAVALEAGKHAERIVRALANVSCASNLQQSLRPISTDPRFKPGRRNGTRAVLDPSLTPADLVPDSLWESVKTLIPAEPHSRTYKPTPRADTRAVLAGIIAHEVYGVAWNRIPLAFNVDRATCRRRCIEWKALGALDGILAEVTKPGVSVAG